LYATGAIDRTTYAQRSQQRDEEVNEVKTERAEIIKQIPDLHKKDIVEVSVQQFCDSVKSRLAICDSPEVKRQFLQDYIEKIIYDRSQVTLIGSVPIKLQAYDDPDQPSDASKIGFSIIAEITRGNWWKYGKESRGKLPL